MRFNCHASLIFIFMTGISFANSAKILIVHPIYAGSHVLTLRSLAEGLVARGHSVHVIRWKEDKPCPYACGKLPGNLTVTTLAINNSDGRFFVLTKEEEGAFQFPDELIWSVGTKPSALLFSPVWRDFFPFFESHCQTLFENKALGESLKNQGFDLAIVDMIWNECTTAYVRHYLKIPLAVGFWGITPETLQTEAKTNFLASAHLPLSPPLNEPDYEPTAIERLKQRFLQGCHMLLAQVIMVIFFNRIEAIVHHHVPSSLSPLQLQQSYDGVMINFEPTLETTALSLPHNFITIGGIQIYDEQQMASVTLPNDISQFMEGDEGVIFFSFGTTLTPTRAPITIFESYLRAFEKFPHKILFQYNGDVSNMTISSNVKVVGWLPQQKLLAHPNMRLFISHCGLQGVNEAIYHGVPLVCMPIVNDAQDTLGKVLRKNVGLGLNMRTLTGELVYEAMREVISNPTYKNNALKLSKVMRSGKETPREKAVAFLEDMLRTNRHGFEFHKIKNSEANQLTIVEYFYLDVLSILTLFMFLTFQVAKYVLRQMFTSLTRLLNFCFNYGNKS